MTKTLTGRVLTGLAIAVMAATLASCSGADGATPEGPASAPTPTPAPGGGTLTCADIGPIIVPSDATATTETAGKWSGTTSQTLTDLVTFYSAVALRLGAANAVSSMTGADKWDYTAKFDGFYGTGTLTIAIGPAGGKSGAKTNQVTVTYACDAA